MWVYKCLHESIGRDTNSETGKKTGTFKPGVKITVDKKKNGWLHHYKTKSWVSYYVPGTKTPAWVCENNGGSSSSSGSTTTTTGEGQIQQSIMSNAGSYKTSSSAPEWIVIHNTGGSNTAESVKTWFQGGAGGRHTGVQYVVDDKTAMQILPDESRPAHCGPRKSTTPAGSKGAGNENSLGIEICDGPKCNIDQAIDNGIEVCRYLMQKYNLGIDRVIKHEDVSGKKCPWYMISGTKGAYNHPPGDGQRWVNFKNECESRNKQGLPFRFGGGGVTAGGAGSWGGEVLPNFDNMENWEWTEKWDGVTITFLPPRNSCSVKDSEKYFAINKYDRTYNYVCDSETFEEKLNPNYIAFSMDDNNRNTYIQNALWGSNKAIKNTVSVGVFIDPKSDNFEKMECKLIQNIGQIMYKLDMDANDLWREFDLNRAASPFMYLDRKKWKLFLDEVHKQLEWRRKKYGEHPKVVPTPVGPPPKMQEQMSSGGPAGYIANGVNIAAEFTSYCPFDGKDATSGGKNDCMGNPLSIGDKVLASPHGKALYGTRAMIYGTGVPQLDGQIYTIRDTGSAIKPKSDLTWVVDILADTTEFANNVVGRIKNACLRIEKVPLEYPYKVRKSLPEDGGFNKPVTTLAEYDTMPIPEDPDSDDNIIDTDDENVNSEISGDRDIASPEHYFEIEEIEGDCPKPSVIITQAEFNELIELYSDSRMIDLYAMKNEPWDKDLKSIREAPVTEDDRLSAMSKKIETQNENTFHYNVVEASPGGSSAGSHCIQPSAELNILAKPDPVNVDPIYPDLTIIPNYATSEYNNFSQNRVPLYMMEESSVADDAAIEGQFSYDYSQLKDKKKESKGKPVNYYDPYVYDDRVHDLELHHPKVKIDEIELKLYECNHPGCPVSQPMAKSISAMAEAHITQSKKLEQRLVRMENTIAWLVRNFGRLGSRMNINCVYYGGQDIFGDFLLPS